MQKERQKVSGFTLAEILVAIAIFGVILSVVVKVYSVSNSSYIVQEDVAAMQQNVRVSKMFLERDVRMAGCGLKNFHHEDGMVYALTFENAAGAAGSDKLTINYIDYGVGSCGGANPCDNLPQLTLFGEMPVNSAEAEVNEELGNAPFDAWNQDCTCSGTTYTQPTPGYKVIITSPDGSQSDVVYVTGVQDVGGGSNDKIQNAPYAGFTNKTLNKYPAGSTINFFNEDKLKQIVYDIKVVDGVFVLRRNSQPIAEDIEDLQFAFRLDTNNDGIVDSWINNADLTDPQKDQVRLVYISVLGRTAKEIRGYSGTRPAIEDHAGSGINDRYRRKKLQVMVKVRNLGL